MNQELIERLWKEACGGQLGTSIAERFAALIAEECAKVCEDRGDEASANAIRDKFPKP